MKRKDLDFVVVEPRVQIRRWLFSFMYVFFWKRASNFLPHYNVVVVESTGLNPKGCLYLLLVLLWWCARKITTTTPEDTANVLVSHVRRSTWRQHNNKRKRISKTNGLEQQLTVACSFLVFCFPAFFAANTRKTQIVFYRYSKFS